MSYETTHSGNTWTHSSSIKGGRREAVKKGVWVIDHRATGKFIIGSSNDVSKEVDQQLKLLAAGKYPNKHLQRQYDFEAQRAELPKDKQPVFVITEYPLKYDRDIKLTLNEIRTSNTAPYCLLN